MKKVIKWFFKILLILIGLIFILMIVIPAFFKDEMLAKVKQEINKNVNAKVEFSDFRLSLFKSFPDLNLGLQELIVTGIDNFENDTLIYFESFDVQVNLMSAIKKNVVVKVSIICENPSERSFSSSSCFSNSLIRLRRAVLEILSSGSIPTE